MKETTCFENRELSWLRFNERVLEEAEDDRIPLCERLSFLSIFQSNLDEFFMVRIGSLHDQRLVDDKARDNKTNMTADEQIDAALAAVRDLCRRRDRVYAGLMEQLGEQGVSLVDFRRISPKSEKKLNKQFRRDFLPYLSAIIVGKKQPFPFLPNKEIYAVGVLATKQEKERIGLVQCSSTAFPRLIEIPEQPGCYMLAEELILHYLPLLFPGYVVTSKTLARITRNADIDADAIYDDEELSYREHMAEVVKRRKRLAPIRLELSRSLEPAVIERLCRQLHLDQKQLFSYDAPLDLSFFGEIRDTLRSRQQLFYPPFRPQDCAQVDMSRSVLEQIAAKDILLHFPYESVRPFLQMLHEAAEDPRVTAICMTLYRLAPHSKVVEALAEAAENGKRVDVLVELKARFVEVNNIVWAGCLEEAGCLVIYGVEHLKVHSKLCLIKRETDAGTQYITQIGTGNYNEKTSRLYTDLSYLTARPEIGLEAERVFEALLCAETVTDMQHLLVAPNCLQNRLLDMIDEQIARVRQGLQGHIRIKINSMSDKALMSRLIEAGQAGVRVEMIIRGINCLRSGIPGKTQNIRVLSVVGQYLEHSRIYIFGDGVEAKYYIGSADWMTRNTLRRVEIACPIVDPSLTERLETIFRVMWEDNCSVREQGPDGVYRRRYPGTDKPLNCQRWLMDQAVLEAGQAKRTGGTARD